MFNRYLEKKLELSTDTDVVGSEIPIKLEYYLLEGSTSSANLGNDARSYGIEIVRNIDNVRFESEMIRSFSSNKQEAISVLERLASNTVTPVSMITVIDQMLGE